MKRKIEVNGRLYKKIIESENFDLDEYRAVMKEQVMFVFSKKISIGKKYEFELEFINRYFMKDENLNHDLECSKIDYDNAESTFRGLKKPILSQRFTMRLTYEEVEKTTLSF